MHACHGIICPPFCTLSSDSIRYTGLEILSEVFDRDIEKMSGWHISRPKDSRSSAFMAQSLCNNVKKI
jgi:hypothetical protein